MPKPDGTLEVTLPPARAALDPAYAADLEAEHAYANRQARSAGGGRMAFEAIRCEWCYRIVSHRHADCNGCGHRPDIQVGHRQTARTPDQQARARKRRAAHKRELRRFR